MQACLGGHCVAANLIAAEHPMSSQAAYVEVSFHSPVAEHVEKRGTERRAPLAFKG